MNEVLDAFCGGFMPFLHHHCGADSDNFVLRDPSGCAVAFPAPVGGVAIPMAAVAVAPVIEVTKEDAGSDNDESMDESDMESLEEEGDNSANVNPEFCQWNKARWRM